MPENSIVYDIRLPPDPLLQKKAVSRGTDVKAMMALIWEMTEYNWPSSEPMYRRVCEMLAIEPTERDIESARLFWKSTSYRSKKLLFLFEWLHEKGYYYS